jgi:hypothetical protein
LVPVLLFHLQSPLSLGVFSLLLFKKERLHLSVRGIYPIFLCEVCNVDERSGIAICIYFHW